MELYLHSPTTPPWRGAQLKHKDNFTFTFKNIIALSGEWTLNPWNQGHQLDWKLKETVHRRELLWSFPETRTGFL
jgi:hypothetical protein